MLTSEIYSFLWRHEAVSLYVMAVAPSCFLRNVTADDEWSAYIINVRPEITTETKRRRSRRRRNRSRERSKLTQSNGDFAGVDCTASLADSTSTSGRNGYGVNGGHWIVLCLNSAECEVFDSLGETDPFAYGKEMYDFVKNYKFYYCNTVSLDESNCGYFCLLFCYFKCLGYGSQRAVNELKKYRKRIRKLCHKVFFSSEVQKNIKKKL